MIEEEYPIHPTADRLIQSFKEFRHVPFPRGIPKPFETWKPLLQAVTKFEQKAMPVVSHYLSGQKADLQNVPPIQGVKQTLQNQRVNSVEESDYLNALNDYVKGMDEILNDLDDCIQELGNPCSNFRIPGIQNQKS